MSSPTCTQPGRMNAHWWNCMLGLLCMPGGVMLSNWAVSQTPPAISLTSLNLSAEISCSTSRPDPTGLRLTGHFHGHREIVYVHFKKNGDKKTLHPDFMHRVDVVQDPETGPGTGFTLRLSLLGLQDTDMYHCTWTYFNEMTLSLETLPSNGTIIIVRERDPYEQCNGDAVHLILIVLSLSAFAVILSLFIGALIFKCTRFKKHYRPAGATSRSKPSRRPLPALPPHRSEQLHYASTSSDSFDFRGIL
ncbi:uncharacterized protein LOC115378035 [Myripristis murdjan]|uniref:uncharacterized protein LOC115378035 n=1 Tax=Myripristis murdjan TaxID=586833 RepID=UPI00117615FB|nr:uncharacterized protein LOC115378035 [Myripristis murdjan]